MKLKTAAHRAAVFALKEYIIIEKPLHIFLFFLTYMYEGPFNKLERR